TSKEARGYLRDCFKSCKLLKNIHTKDIPSAQIQGIRRSALHVGDGGMVARGDSQ
ncbi:Hypothetical protein SMAX5B_003451, partial [Scophthalmus maximus]